MFIDLGFYASPAKEELSPMFPHNSSSHEISTQTNAFVQNSVVSEDICFSQNSRTESVLISSLILPK